MKLQNVTLLQILQETRAHCSELFNEEQNIVSERRWTDQEEYNADRDSQHLLQIDLDR